MGFQVQVSPGTLLGKLPPQIAQVGGTVSAEKLRRAKQATAENDWAARD